MAKRLQMFLLLLFLPLAAGAATNDNDDSCDIAVLPAATLLLPYFEVDLEDPAGETTLFTITNVTNLDQIAHVTLWTDYGFPVIDFNIYLTGYDVQAINLFDILARGLIAPDAGTGTAVTKRQQFSDRNLALDLTDCDRLPGSLDQAYLIRMQRAFTRGSVPDLGTLEGCDRIGGEHDRAIGYATVDVTRVCSTALPTDPTYWTNDIRYDNVLIGDYHQINSHENFAQGGTMVHIRAIPEGGTPDTRAKAASLDAGFERTFYSRYQAASTPRLDGRQPLPSTFATRWINGSSSEFQTSMKIWREGRTDRSTACDTYQFEARRRTTEVVVFDENENAVTMVDAAGGSGIIVRPELPSTSRTSIDDGEIYPQLVNGGTAGWVYFNLDHTRGDFMGSQNWVVSSMRAQGRFSTDIDGIALGNGCSAPAETSGVTVAGAAPIAPALDFDRPPTGVASTRNDDSCDIALLPAATLLLPYFEVDVENPAGETTLFTVTNASPNDQIARVTLWTDGSYPVLTFNVYLTGYDVQAINLFDVIERGVVAPDGGTGTRVTARGDHSVRNAALDLSDCRNLAGQIEPAQIARIQQAFTTGTVPAFGGAAACNTVGLEHDNAVGYATIDVVRTCSSNTPYDRAYWTDDLLYDNVLIGDYQQVSQSQNFAQGAPMVHVRAVPEGGTPATRGPSQLERTFYRHHQSIATPGLDGRQPLPTEFAARWIQGSASYFQTSWKIWRERKATATRSCASHPANANMNVPEVVRFDEAENAVGEVRRSRVCAPLFIENTLPATVRLSVTDSSIVPQMSNGAVGGWAYINLDNCDEDDIGSSNWVVVSMRAEGRYSVDIDAAGLGNGCSPPAPISEVTDGRGIIGPAPNTH